MFIPACDQCNDSGMVMEVTTFDEDRYHWRCFRCGNDWKTTRASEGVDWRDIYSDDRDVMEERFLALSEADRVEVIHQVQATAADLVRILGEGFALAIDQRLETND